MQEEHPNGKEAVNLAGLSQFVARLPCMAALSSQVILQVGIP